MGKESERIGGGKPNEKHSKTNAKGSRCTKFENSVNGKGTGKEMKRER